LVEFDGRLDLLVERELPLEVRDGDVVFLDLVDVFIVQLLKRNCFGFLRVELLVQLRLVLNEQILQLDMLIIGLLSACQVCFLDVWLQMVGALDLEHVILRELPSEKVLLVWNLRFVEALLPHRLLDCSIPHIDILQTLILVGSFDLVTSLDPLGHRPVTRKFLNLPLNHLVDKVTHLLITGF